jgi:hypothetical protein
VLEVLNPKVLKFSTWWLGRCVELLSHFRCLFHRWLSVALKEGEVSTSTPFVYRKNVSGKGTYRTFVELDPYEARLLSRLFRDLTTQAKNSGKRRPTKKSLISACVRTAVHVVYGEEYGYEELLTPEKFRELMTEVDLGPEEAGA